MTLFKKLSLSIFIALFAVGCTQEQSQDQEMELTEPETEYSKAIAVINPTEGNNVTGSVTFEQVDEGVQVEGEFEGLSAGLHGFHIHEFGDCSADDGSSAGGHYNPTDNDHGNPEAENRHMGDMGNIEADEEGSATIDYVDSKIELNGPNSIMGRGVIIHGGEDDFESQPSGDAGPRLGCGVVGVAND